MPVIFVKVEQWYYLTAYWWRGNKGVHIFPQIINPKVNIIVGVDLELEYYLAAVQQVCHNATLTLSRRIFGKS